MHTPGLIKNFDATAAVPARTIVKPSATAGGVQPAAAATDKLLGISTGVDSAAGARCDVILSGAADVVAGGAVAAGDLVTSGADGKAVAAAPAAGANARTVGTALTAAVAAGDIITVLVAPGSVQGA